MMSQTLYSLIVYIWLLQQQGVIGGEPTLLPSTDLFVCSPNDTVTFTCHGRQISAMQWIAGQYVPMGKPITFIVAHIDVGSQPITNERSTDVFSTLLYIKRSNDIIGDMTTSLTANTKDLENGTNIICRTYRGDTLYQSNSILYFADVPYWKNSSITYHQENETFFTAVLQLGDMFDGGGVPIDHYIIQVDNNTQLETTDLTYSVDVMYNDTLFVNISAHNCAGYSDSFSLTIEFNHEESKDLIEDDVMTECSPTSLPIIVSITASIVIVVMTVLLMSLLAVYKVIQRCTKSHNNRARYCSDSEVNVGCTATTENDISKSETEFPPSSISKLEPDYMENNPLYSYNNNVMRNESTERKPGIEEYGDISLHVYDTIQKVVM